MSRKTGALGNVAVIVGVFAAIGVGLGLTGYVSLGWLEGTFTSADQSEIANSIGQMMIGLVFLQSIIVVFFTGPTVAALASLISGVAQSSRSRAAGIGAVGSFLGFYVMVALALVVMSLAYGGGSGGGGESGSFDFGKTLITGAKAGIPTAAVGLASGYIGGGFEGMSVSVGGSSAGGGVSGD